MSLEGNLTAFGLSEILQLIAVQQKSGMLSVSSEERSMVLFFREGNIISTRDRRRKNKDPLRDYLIRYGVLSREDLIRISQISAQSKLDLTEIIVSEGFLGEDEMRKHYRNQIQEAVHEVLTWEQCHYKFMPGNDIIDGIKTWGEFGIEGFLMESMRRIDEFSGLSRDFPDERAQIQKVSDPDESQELTSNDTAILDLLSRERTLAYLVSHSMMPKFETYEALKHLKEKELIHVRVEREGDEEEERTTTRGKRRKRRKPRNVVPVNVAMLLFIGASFFGSQVYMHAVSRPIGDHHDVISRSSITRDRVGERLRWLLEAYRAQYGVYPSDLPRLVEAGLADEEFLEKARALSFRYYLTPDESAYTLL